jgi:hypothetical protein
LWWAKSQQWHATAWALALIAGLVGVAQLFFQDDCLRFAVSWRIPVLVFLVALTGSWYLGCLWGDMLDARRRLRRGDARLDSSGKEPAIGSDCTRGVGFVLTMQVAIAVAASIATYAVARDAEILATVLGFVTVLWGLIWVAIYSCRKCAT